MAISVADNFSYKGSKPLDARIQYSTVANMKNATTSDLYDGCLAYVTATKKNYQYDSTNSVDPTTGKWRELQTGGGGASAFSDLTDVSIFNIQNGQVPKWNSVTEKWENGNEGGSGGGHVIEDAGVALTQRDTLNFVDFDLEDDTQNEKTVVQSHELTQEEFEEIFSSGLPGAITGFDMSNTTCEANIHSTDERVIGQWVDGKPLYQKSFTFTTGSSSNIDTIGTIANISTAVNIKGYLQLANATIALPWLYNTSVSSAAYAGAMVSGSDVKVMYGGSDYCNRTGSLTIQYTKTTDTAVASGEKIVGQWIDGKPLYQKTYSLTNVSATKNLSTLLSVDSMNVKDIKGYCSFNNVNADLFVNTILGSNDYQFFVYNDNGTLKYTAYYYGNTIKEVVLTLQYTKL